MLRKRVGARERGVHERNNTRKEKREKEYLKISGK